MKRYERQPLNTAQQIYLAMGVDPIALIAHKRGRTPSFTKKGPGRKSQRGRRRDDL